MQRNNKRHQDEENPRNPQRLYQKDKFSVVAVSHQDSQPVNIALVQWVAKATLTKQSLYKTLIIPVKNWAKLSYTSFTNPFPLFWIKPWKPIEILVINQEKELRKKVSFNLVSIWAWCLKTSPKCALDQIQRGAVTVVTEYWEFSALSRKQIWTSLTRSVIIFK